MSLHVLVTGANKGIGFEIVRRLLTAPSVSAITFTSRNLEAGEAALKNFELENAHSAALTVLQLDLLNQTSIKEFHNQILAKKLSFDAVIFNAGVAFYNVVNAKVLETTMTTNFYANVELTKTLIDGSIVKPGGRFIYVSSSLGCPDIMKENPEVYDLIKTYQTEAFTEETLLGLAKRYDTEILESKLAKPWPQSIYAASKLFLTMFASVAARKYPEYKFYACCPGWCKTDMTKGTAAPLTAEEGADTPVFLATDDQLAPTANGKFFSKREEKAFAWSE